MKKKRTIGFLLLLINMALMVSCSRGKKNQQNDLSSTATPNVEIGLTGAVTPPSGTTITPTVGTEDQPNHIVWAVSGFAYISEETQAEIQRLIEEKGIDCTIEFTSAEHYGGEEYVAWLNGEKEKNSAPDILTGCFWKTGTIEGASFLKKEFYPLNEFLQTENGSQLYDAYAKLEWKRTEVDGKIYIIPNRPRSERKDSGVYLYVNTQYESYFDSFDGTYDSLRKVYDEVHDDNLIIAMGSAGTITTLAMMGGYREIYDASYHEPSQKYIDLTRDTHTKEFLMTWYTDLQEGLLVSEVEPEDLPENALAYIHYGKLDSLNGYSEYVVLPDLYETLAGGSYGVLKDSTHKDLAIQVLAACYSDPRIASLLTWRESDEEEWQEKTAYLKTCQASSFTGFVPALSKEQIALLDSYNDAVDSLVRSIYDTRGNKPVLNPDYVESLEQFFSRQRDYGDVFDVLNQQLDLWYREGKH